MVAPSLLLLLLLLLLLRLLRSALVNLQCHRDFLFSAQQSEPSRRSVVKRGMVVPSSPSSLLLSFLSVYITISNSPLFYIPFSPVFCLSCFLPLLLLSLSLYPSISLDVPRSFSRPSPSQLHSICISVLPPLSPSLFPSSGNTCSPGTPQMFFFPP